MLNMIDYLTEEEIFKVIDICQEFTILKIEKDY